MIFLYWPKSTSFPPWVSRHCSYNFRPLFLKSSLLFFLSLAVMVWTPNYNDALYFWRETTKRLIYFGGIIFIVFPWHESSRAIKYRLSMSVTYSSLVISMSSTRCRFYFSGWSFEVDSFGPFPMSSLYCFLNISSWPSFVYYYAGVGVSFGKSPNTSKLLLVIWCLGVVGVP